jgi:hypothetical protein
MKLENLPISTTDWSQVPAAVHQGASGTATNRACQFGEIQLRLVDYSPDYVADHWCSKGHIVFVAAGSLIIEHRDGRQHTLKAGMSYQVPDDADSPHRALSVSGATIFVLD